MSDEREPGAAPALPAQNEPAHGVDRGDRPHEFRGESVSVTWSRRRCIHAGECVMNLPAVFAPGRRPWIEVGQDSADAIAEVVGNCPTGALHFERSDGARETAPTTNSARLTWHGPIYLHGDIELLDESSTLRLADTRMALCRCGKSANKPLCDNSHLAAGFRDAGAVSAETAGLDSEAGSGKLRVRPLPNGPLEFEGPFTLAGSDGRTTPARSGARLCRCGNSQNKPFCDGSHLRAGFVSD